MSVRRDTFYNLAGSFFPLVVALFTIPAYIALIGEDRYGILSILWLLLGYLGLFDFGLGRAIAQRMASCSNTSDSNKSQIFSTAIILNLILGMIGGMLAWPISIYLFDKLFNVSDALQLEIMQTLPWLAIAVPISILTGTLTGALQGVQRFLQLNLISILGSLLFQLIPLFVAIRYSVDLSVLLPSVIFSRFLTVSC